MKIVSANKIAPDGMPRFAISIVSDSRDLKRTRLSGACYCFKLHRRHSLLQGISISTSSVAYSYSCCLVLSIALHVLMTSKFTQNQQFINRNKYNLNQLFFDLSVRISDT